jgi:hypothetical protein
MNGIDKTIARIIKQIVIASIFAIVVIIIVNILK